MSIERAKEVLKIEAEGLLACADLVDNNFQQAVDLIMACSGRVIITGIGKSGIIGQKIAATMNSTGTPSFFLHPVEAMHGDLGMVGPDDVVLAISNSGETAELNMLLPSLKKRQVKIIAMTGKKNSSLSTNSDATLNVAVPREACPLGLAPTTSTTAMLAMGDALAVVLLELKQFKACDFRRNHPGGSLGERLKVQVSEIMLVGDMIPKITTDATLPEAVQVLNDRNLGAVIIMLNAEQMAGILTDGDIRRLVSQNLNLSAVSLKQAMTEDPKTIAASLLVADAISLMQRYEITILPVTDLHGQLKGVLHLQDLLGKGEFRFLV